MQQSELRTTSGLRPSESLALTLLLSGFADTAARSLLRTWVDLYWHQNISRYTGHLLLWVAVVWCAGGACCLVWAWTTGKRFVPHPERWRWGVRFLSAGNVGFVVAAACQAMMHFAGLSGPSGGELHPRSLTISSAAASVFGVFLLILAAQRQR